VIGSVDDWFLIRQVIWTGYDLDEKLLFSGPGWIAAGLVSFSAEDPWLRSAPRADAAKIRGFSSDGNAAPGLEVNDAIIKRVHRCSGSFVDVDLEAPDGRKARGWVTGVCANQVTTCGGGSDYVEERDGKLGTVETLANEE
jgi:hypothetical protein